MRTLITIIAIICSLTILAFDLSNSSNEKKEKSYIIREDDVATFIWKDSVIQKYNPTKYGEFFIIKDNKKTGTQLYEIVKKVLRENRHDKYPIVFKIHFKLAKDGKIKSTRFSIPNTYKDSISLDEIIQIDNALMSHIIQGCGNYNDSTVESFNITIRLKSGE